MFPFPAHENNGHLCLNFLIQFEVTTSENIVLTKNERHNMFKQVQDGYKFMVFALSKLS